MVIDTIDGRKRNVYSACLINDVPNVHWKPGLCLAIVLTNSMAISSQLFDMRPHSPGNDGNVSNVKSNLVYSRPLHNIISKGIKICVAGNGRRKTSHAKTRWKILKEWSAYPPRTSGTGREKRTSFGKVWANWEKAFIPMPLAERAVFYNYVENGEAY